MFPLSVLAIGVAGQAHAVNFIYSVNGDFNVEKAERQVNKAGGKLLSCIEQISVYLVAFDSVDKAQNSGLQLVPDVTAFVPKVDSGLTEAELTVTMDSFGNRQIVAMMIYFLTYNGDMMQ